MYLHRCAGRAWLASLASFAISAATASAQFPPGMITGFEPPGPTEPVGYTTGPLQFQDNWEGGSAWPRVQTADEIAAELTTAGLNPANPIHSGNQALLATKVNTNVESTGYFVRNIYAGLEGATKVTAEWWARPLTSGLGADPAGTPAGNGKTIGERQGNTFVGIMDSNGEVRAAAVRFGIVVEPGNPNPYTNAQVRTIDFASASAGSAVWVPSGLTWTADAWYNFKFELDYETKTYDFFVNDAQVNTEPIRFYNEASQAATRLFVSRGTNQAGQIVDDISVTATVDPPDLAGDFDDDDDVDGNDFLVWQRDLNVGSLDDWQANFGASQSQPATSAVPEPSGAALALGMMLLGIGGRFRERRSPC